MTGENSGNEDLKFAAQTIRKHESKKAKKKYVADVEQPGSKSGASLNLITPGQISQLKKKQKGGGKRKGREYPLPEYCQKSRIEGRHHVKEKMGMGENNSKA